MSPETETRADVARRRLARLAESFETELVDARPSKPTPMAAQSHAEPRPSKTKLLASAHARAVGTVAVAALLLLAWYLFAQRPQTSPPLAPVGFAASGGPAAKKSGEIVIDVIGAVKRPGIVTLPPGSRVHQAIAAAGGLKGRVDTRSLNMARVLDDGEQINVGAPATQTGGPQAVGGTGQTNRISLNQATPEQLDTLPGVGPVTAQAIIDWREKNGRFSNVDELLDVDGIGEATLAKLRELVTV